MTDAKVTPTASPMFDIASLIGLATGLTVKTSSSVPMMVLVFRMKVSKPSFFRFVLINSVTIVYVLTIMFLI